MLSYLVHLLFTFFDCQNTYFFGIIPNFTYFSVNNFNKKNSLLLENEFSFNRLLVLY